MTWQAMSDLDPGDTLPASELDAMRLNLEYLLNPPHGRALLTGGNYSTTSTSFVDVDSTNAKVEITTSGGPVLVVVTAVVMSSVADGNVCLDLNVGGSREGQTTGLMIVTCRSAGKRHNASFCHLVTGLSAGTHTIKLQWLASPGTGYLLAHSSDSPLELAAIEL